MIISMENSIEKNFIHFKESLKIKGVPVDFGTPFILGSR